MNEEISLSEYIDVIIRRWKWIVGSMVVAALAAGVVGFVQPPVYQAAAAVAIVKSRSEITFSQEFRTLSEEEMAVRGISMVNLEERRKALAGLVRNAAVAAQVLAELGSNLPEEEQNLSALLEMVKAETGGEEGDLIRIIVSSDDPVKAAQIANAWAQAYETYVNAVYGVSSASPAMVRNEMAVAKESYDEAQRALMAFVAENQIDELNMLIEEKKNIIQRLQEGKSRAVSTIIDTEVDARIEIIASYINAQTQNRLVAFNKEQEGKRELVSGYIAAQTASRNAVFNEQVTEKLEALSHYYDKKALLERLLGDAQGLRELVGTGGAFTTTSNALAILLLKAEAFASSGELPGGIELQLGAISGLDRGATAQAADLDALIDVLEDELAGLETSIQDLSRELLSNEGYDFLDVEFPTEDPLSLAIKEAYPDLFEIADLAALTEALPSDNPLKTMVEERSKELLQLQALETISQYTAAAEPLSVALENLHDEVDALQAQLEAEQARQRELTRARDLAWQTYSTLADKVAEVDIATSVGGTQVRFAAPAVPPRRPVSPRKKLNIAVAGAVGLMVGIFGAFGAEYLGRANEGKE